MLPLCYILNIRITLRKILGPSVCPQMNIPDTRGEINTLTSCYAHQFEQLKSPYSYLTDEHASSVQDTYEYNAPLIILPVIYDALVVGPLTFSTVYDILNHVWQPALC